MLRKGESRAPALLDWVVILRKADGQRPISDHFYFILGGDAPKNAVDFRVKRWVPMLRNFQLTMNESPVAGLEGQNGLFASAVQDGDMIYVKVANTSEKAQDITLNFTGLKKKATVKAVKRIDLSSPELYEDNSIEKPDNIVPAEAAFSGEGTAISAGIAPLSFSILVLQR